MPHRTCHTFAHYVQSTCATSPTSYRCGSHSLHLTSCPGHLTTCPMSSTPYQHILHSPSTSLMSLTACLHARPCFDVHHTVCLHTCTYIDVHHVACIHTCPYIDAHHVVSTLFHT